MPRNGYGSMPRRCLMRELERRVSKLETTSGSAWVFLRAIDRPPQETREQWIARQAGHPIAGALNERGETREQWVERRTRELQETGP